MKRSQTCFEVAVTPPHKKKAPAESSPILTLGKFKGSPSLFFKDVKVGSTASRGFWAENPNNCTVTVVLAKLPSAERGLSFSESEFILEAGCSHRIGVEWTPMADGCWREIIKVEVWGLPPPHLSFRVILHLTSVKPKPKRKCCPMALRPQNPRSSKEQSNTTASNPPSSCCHSHPPPQAGNGQGEETVAERQPILRKEHKRPTSIERDSLENTPPGLPSIDVISVDDGVLPSCDVPSASIRRNTYCLESVESDTSSNPLHVTDTVKCCPMALRPQNPRSSKEQSNTTASNPPSSCCHSHPPPQAGNGQGEETVAERQPILRKQHKRPTSIERDSLENTPPGLPSIDVISVDDGVLPSCDVPSTPIRRNTYCFERVESDTSSKPLHVTDTVFEENVEKLPGSVAKKGLRFLEALDELLAPINLSEDLKEERIPTKNAHLTPAIPLTNSNQKMLHQRLGQRSTEEKAKNFVSSFETNSTRSLFLNKGVMEEKTKNLLVDSTPLQHPNFKYLTTKCSPTPPVSEECTPKVSVNTSLGYQVSEQGHVAEVITRVNINHAIILGPKSEPDLEKVIQRHCNAVQSNWKQVQEEIEWKLKMAKE